MSSLCNSDEDFWVWVSASNGVLRMGHGNQLYVNQVLAVADKSFIEVLYIGISGKYTEWNGVCAAPCAQLNDWTMKQASPADMVWLADSSYSVAELPTERFDSLSIAFWYKAPEQQNKVSCIVFCKTDAYDCPLLSSSVP